MGKGPDLRRSRPNSNTRGRRRRGVAEKCAGSVLDEADYSIAGLLFGQRHWLLPNLLAVLLYVQAVHQYIDGLDNPVPESALRQLPPLSLAASNQVSAAPAKCL